MFNQKPLTIRPQHPTGRAICRFDQVILNKRNTLVYLVYSDKLIDGSPKNSVTAVPVPPAQPIPLK
jgi:catabolite regulation protein CreA